MIPRQYHTGRAKKVFDAVQTAHLYTMHDVKTFGPHGLTKAAVARRRECQVQAPIVLGISCLPNTLAQTSRHPEIKRDGVRRFGFFQ